MDNTTYPGSETDYDHCEFQSTASNDFVDRWVNLTVDKEVLRGCKLREEKLKSYPQLLECETVNIDYPQSPCLEDPSHFMKASQGRKRGKTTPCSPRSNSPFVRPKPGSRCTPQTVYSRPNTPSVQTRCVPRCPMRIAELAVPTKRQCFDTWRNKCDVLPACMVERLRQQVMNEKPIVQISEAISCFQRRRPKSVRSMNRRPKKVSRETKQRNERIDEIRKLCAAFADKIAHKLITPQNLNLNPELDKLSKVIANEIANIIQNRKKYNINNNTHRRIHADVSAKIAVWIATILEDSSYKLLEEDLRVQPCLKKYIGDDRIITLMGKVGSKEKTSELEEEEGPVLDFIDELVHNVITICEPDMEKDDVSETTSKAASDQYDGGIESPESTGNNEFDTSTLYTNITYDTGDGTVIKSNEMEPVGSKTQISVIQEIDNQSFDATEGIELTINDQIQGEINKIIDFVTANNDTETSGVVTTADDIEIDFKHVLGEKEYDKNVSEHETDLTRGLIHQSPGNSELANEINEVRSVSDLPVVEKASSNSYIIGEADNDKSNQLVESEGANLNDALELSSEESLDEKNKKVKFSEIDMASRGSISKLLDGVGVKQVKGDETENVTWIDSTDSMKQDLVLAPPNDNLLSDADESWPEDIPSSTLKPSASVSRSVTSLGRILEKDEKLFLVEDEIVSVLNLEGAKNRDSDEKSGDQGDTPIELMKTVDNGAFIQKKDKLETSKTEDIKLNTMVENKEDQNIKKDTIDISVVGVGGNEKIEAKCTPIEIDRQKIQDPKTILQKLEQDRQFQQTVGQTVQSDLKPAESEANFIYEAIQQKIKSSYVLPEPKFDYKVHPNTAPSWLRHDSGKGEPSEDSFRDGCNTKAKFKESEIRSWCKDLDRIFVNLEMWNNWVDTTCKNVLHLKQKREMNRLFAPNAIKKDAKEWVTLKKNIDKDTVLWTKLNQRVYERLKCYKDKAKYNHNLAEKPEMMHVKPNGTDFETILKTMEDIDRTCLWMHRTIVSTEYCMACDWKNNPRRKM